MKSLRSLIAAVLVGAWVAYTSASFTIPNANNVSFARLAVPMQSDWNIIAAAMGGSGVTSGCAVTPSTPATFIVNVAACAATIDGLSVTNPGGTVTVSAPNTTPRLDLVVMERDGDLAMLRGAPSTTAYTQSPDMTQYAVLATVYVANNSLSIAAANIVDKRMSPATSSTPTPALYWQINPLDYGAVCDGSTDDTAAIQATFDAMALIGSRSAKGMWPPQYCLVTQTVILGSTVSGTDSFLQIEGVSPITSGLLWGGATNGTTLRLARNKYFAIKNFGVANTVAAGTTVGIEFGGNTAVNGGTQTLAGVLETTYSSGYSVCLKGGGSNGAASEVTSTNHTFENCEIGYLSIDFNTLDWIFINPSGSSNDIVIDWGASENGKIIGGSFSNSTVADVKIEQVGTFEIDGLRSEGANRVLTSTSVPNVQINGLLAVSPSNADKIAITGTYHDLSVTGSRLDGRITIDGATFLSLTSSTVFGTPILPFSIVSASAIPTHYEITNVQFRDPAGSLDTFAYRDEIGNTGTFDSPGFPSVTTTWPVQQIERGRPNAQATPNNPGDALLLYRVRMLGEGTRAVGRNLRLQSVLGAGTTTVVNLQRTVTVSIDSPILLATSGRFYPADVGKRVSMTGGSLGATVVILFIDQYTDSTHVRFEPHSDFLGCCFSQTGVAATIGENEPDAFYIPVVSCQIPIAVGVDTLGVSSFTLTHTASLGNLCNIGIYR